jgi:tripartite ATP-independent transporter DctM subunit
VNPEWIAGLLFLCVLAFLFAGYPVAFTLGGVSLIFGGIGVAMDVFPATYLFAFFERGFGVMSNYVLLAVPFFIFMGAVLEKSKLAEDLLQTVGQIFGPVRGGLAMAVVFVGALLAAATGVIGASVVAMGTISLPVMLRYGYRKELATGVIAASGTLGQIIPPSVVLVVLADQIGTSVGDLFQGALTPGLLLASLYGVYALVISLAKPEWAPALPAEERQLSTGQLAKRVCLVLIPPLALILIVLGSIFAGVATPTEAGALGALGALVLAFVSKRLTWTIVRETMEATTLLTSMVMFLLLGSTLFALVFRGFYGDVWIEDLLTNLPGGLIGALILANVAVFVLGFFIDFFEIAFIVVPLLAPVLVQQLSGQSEWLLGEAASGELATRAAATWFGVMIAMNLQTSFLTPPFGFALFYLKGVCPDDVKTTEIYKGVLPFIGIQVLGLVLICVFPGLVTWLLD